MTVTADWDALRADAAARYEVSELVHPDDLLWPFIVSHPAFADPVVAADYYFSDGAESAHKLQQIVATHVPLPPSGRRASLLEFASGYGMVTRHLPAALPQMDLLSCDIHPQANEFVREHLGVTAVQSHDEPEQLNFDRRFDVVFALSFFSHMPRTSFSRWLGALFNVVAPGGIFVFTAHGLASCAPLGNPELDEDGFWFKPDSEQHDLDGARYGSTISTADYVIRELFKTVRAPIAEFRGGYWWNHQDLYVVARDR